MRHSEMPVRFLIAGTPRSGTTLVQRLACELPGVRVPPETQFLWSFAPDLVRRRRFPLDEDVLREEIRLFANRKLSVGLQLEPDTIIEILKGRCSSPLHLFSAIVEQLAGPARAYGEKSPRNLLISRRLGLEVPHLKVVIVVRDPRATVRSNLDVPWDIGRPWGPRSPTVLAKWWDLDQKEALKTKAVLGDRCLVLRYEDIVADPDASKSLLAGFLGFKGTLGPAQDDASLDASEIMFPWESWKANVLGRIQPDRNEAWRSSLTETEAADVAAICRRSMLRFGYLDDLPSRSQAAFRRTRQSWRQTRGLGRLKAFRYKEGITIGRLVPQIVSPKELALTS